MKSVVIITIAVLCVLGLAFLALVYSAFGNRDDGRRAWRIASLAVLFLVSWATGGFV